MSHDRVCTAQHTSGMNAASGSGSVAKRTVAAWPPSDAGPIACVWFLSRAATPGPRQLMCRLEAAHEKVLITRLFPVFGPFPSGMCLNVGAVIREHFTHEVLH
jgi:hypothetical protein